MTESGTDTLVIASRRYQPRLFTDTGKLTDPEQTCKATEASGAEIVSVAIWCNNVDQGPERPNLLDVRPPERYTILPKTTAAYSADESVRTLSLAHERLDGHKLDSREVRLSQ